MKNIILFIVVAVAAMTMGCQPTKVADNTRDYAYEAWCDSLYEADPNYFLDVYIEGDEYWDYIDKHGEWWE